MKQVIAASQLASNTTFNGIQTNNITPSHNEQGNSQSSFNNGNVPAPPPGFENPPSHHVRTATTVIRIKRVDETTTTRTPAAKTLKNNLTREIGRAHV